MIKGVYSTKSMRKNVKKQTKCTLCFEKMLLSIIKQINYVRG